MNKLIENFIKTILGSNFIIRITKNKFTCIIGTRYEIQEFSPTICYYYDNPTYLICSLTPRGGCRKTEQVVIYNIHNKEFIFDDKNQEYNDGIQSLGLLLTMPMHEDTFKIMESKFKYTVNALSFLIENDLLKIDTVKWIIKGDIDE